MLNGYYLYMEKIYVKISKTLPKSEIIKAENTLAEHIVNHSKEYKSHNKYIESISAWYVLNELLLKITGKSLDFYSVKFSTRGKPLIDNGYISLSHSSGTVAVCYSLEPCAIDIEEVKNTEKYQAVLKRVGLSECDSDVELFKRYTAVEGTAKLNDKPFIETISKQCSNVIFINKQYENCKYVAAITAHNPCEIIEI